MNTKITLIIITTILAVNHTHAQFVFSSSILPVQPSHHRATSSGRTTSAASRLINEVAYVNDGVSFYIKDSTALTYSGNHGGDVTHQPIKFDVGYKFNYSTTSLSYSNYQKVTNNFDAGDNITSELVQIWVPWINNWRNYQQGVYTYDAMNNYLSESAQNWDTATASWVNEFRDTYTYDGSENLTLLIHQDWNTGTSAWVNNNENIYTYTTTNKIATQAGKSWNIAGSAWVNYSNTINNYDGSGNLTSSILQAWDLPTSAWLNDGRHVYTYDGSHDQLTDSFQTWNVGSGSWVNSTNYIYSSFVATQPQLAVNQYWNTGTLAFINSQEQLSTYNGFNQITYQYTKDWNAGGFWETTSADRATKYGYESYDTKVSAINNTIGKVDVYPVPAKDILSVDISWFDRQAFAMSVIDMQGRVLSQQEQPACLKYNGNIPVSNIPPGNYILRIDGAASSITRQFTITR